MGLSIDFLHGIEMIGLMFLVGLTFSSIGLYLATVAKESSNFQLLVMIIMVPLTFFSGAYIPTMALPKIIAPLVYLNPLTYTTAAFRFISLNMGGLPSETLVKAGVAFNLSGFIITPAMSLLIILTMCVIFFTLCVKRFNSADFSKVRIFKHEH
jgi:ABC-2 type transport system permease protein